MNDRLTAISRIPYLCKLPRAERELLASVSEIRHVADGAHVFSEGDKPTGIFLIINGRVKLVRASENGREQVLHEECAGATLAEVPAFDREGYVGSAVAVGDTSVCLVPRKPLLDALERDPASASVVIQILAARLRKFAALVEDLSLRVVSERLAGYLLQQSDSLRNCEFELPTTRDQLAAHVGTVREQVSRALTAFKRDGIITVDGRRVRILDRKRVERIAGRH